MVEINKQEIEWIKDEIWALLRSCHSITGRTKKQWEKEHQQVKKRNLTILDKYFFDMDKKELKVMKKLLRKIYA